jgi:hypothetical protein
MKYRVALSLIAGCALLAASFSSFATISVVPGGGDMGGMGGMM